MDAHPVDRIARDLATGSAPAPSRRRLLRLAAGAVPLLLGARFGAAGAAAGTCRATGQRCGVDPDCCSARCEDGRCRAGDLAPGSICRRRQECRSGICGAVNSEVGICRTAGCRRPGRRCRVSTQCCRGVCSASRRECVD